MKKPSYLEDLRVNNTFEDFSIELIKLTRKIKKFIGNNEINQSEVKNHVEKYYLRDKDQLLSLQVVGSTLHGTRTKNSDADIKGIFIPSKKSLILNEKRNVYKYSSTKNNETNTYGDLDISFYSIHFVLNKISKGDLNFLELLFSLNNEESVIYKNKRMNCLYYNRFKFFDKEGIKHSFLGFIKNHYLNINDKIIKRKTYDKNDLKRLAHAYRAMVMLQEILNTKNISFPLKEAEFIRNIKENKIDIFSAIKRIEKRLPELKEKANKNSFILDEANEKDIETMILSFY
jgi:predicted nucleotidyltransferase